MEINYEKGGGLVPAVVQHADTGAVLMLGYLSAEALAATLSTRHVTFYSRSKQRLWTKGETSGHTLDYLSHHIDCDGDTVLIVARPRGPVCHTGDATCFGEPKITWEIPSNTNPYSTLADLESVIAQRIATGADDSYVKKLVGKGLAKVSQKVGEEGVELALEGVQQGNDAALLGEAADLLFHTLILLQARGHRLADVLAVLDGRKK
jgi:phosphoribosyl-ATP pyrophosphohydrolase/phosphoribosyl-AMP cyclohydrolase